jgi:hypothetical protein
MFTSMHSIRGVAVGAVGAGMVTGAMLFGGAPAAQAAPGPARASSFAIAGPHGPSDIPAGPAIVPTRWGHGGWGRGGLFRPWF